MSYWEKKIKHAYKCYKKGVPRRKVYSVVEKDGKYLVLKCRPNSENKYALAGGTIEKFESVKRAIKRELLEEMNVKTEFVKLLGVINAESEWSYKGEKFVVKDEFNIVLTQFVEYGKRKRFGLKEEFEIQDIVAEVSKEEMMNNVYEFTDGGIKLD